jgi:exopolysaccharide biosynthesis WecB/TagA/CpsF family protein
MVATDPVFRFTFDQADIIHADGQAAVLASRLLTATPIPERSATTDFIHDAAKAAAEHGLRFFLLGATEEANAEAARVLRETYPGLHIVGRRHGYFSLTDEDDICDEINLTQPDVIWVGLSVPLEYEFAVRNKARLQAGWLVTCGGCFNFVTGAYKRAPLWMQAAGLEWLFRLWREPKRLFWRYAVTNPLAIFLLLTRTNSGLRVPA